MNSLGDSLLSGAAGAAAVTLVHQTARALTPEAPRMDTLGREALAHVLRAAGLPPPPRGVALQAVTLAGDLIANTLYYALVGLGRPRRALGRGALLGALAGAGALALPGPLGLSRGAASATKARAGMTLSWYLLGGLAAAGLLRTLRKASGAVAQLSEAESLA